MDKETISLLKKELLNFLWDGKPPKIKYSTIIGDYCEGDIRFVDIENKIKSLQITWVRNCKGGQPWQHIFKQINKLSWERVVTFNCKIDGLICGDFYKNILTAWQEIYFNETYLDNIWKQPVIYNKHIKINKKMVTKGLPDNITIGDILNNKAIDNLNPFSTLILNGVKTAIPQKFKAKWKTRAISDIKIDLIKIKHVWKPIKKTNTKEIYREFISDIICAPTSIRNLEVNTNTEIETDLWQSFFQRNYNYTKNRHFRTWQYKILHNIHNTRKNLVKWKIINNGECERCSSGEVEDTDHYFLTCSFNKNLLKQIHNKVGDLLNTRIHMTNAEYITGMWTVNFKENTIFSIDKLIYLGRIFIIQSRRTGRPVSMKIFLLFVLNNINENEIFENSEDGLWDIVLDKINQ
jgi:hypothetical protein